MVKKKCKHASRSLVDEKVVARQAKAWLILKKVVLWCCGTAPPTQLRPSSA
jgi:hypothetical protein